MIKTVTTKPDTLTDHILFFDQADLTKFTDNVVPLFGPNGVGKSTFLKAIKDALNHSPEVKVTTTRPTMVLSYLNSEDNLKIRKARTYAESFDPFFLSERYDTQLLSEGQSIIHSMLDLLTGLSAKKDPIKYDDKDICILLDEIDSGLSLDNLDMVMRKIKYISKQRPDIQIIFSFNSPRILKYFPKVLSMYDGQPIELHNEDELLLEIHAHDRVFNKSRRRRNGKPKVPGKDLTWI